MYNSTAAHPQPLQSLASASVTASYQPVGVALIYPARIVYIINASSQGITVSWDGINDHDFIPANTTREYEIGTQRGNGAPALDIPQGIVFSVKGTAGTGTIYVAAISAIIPSTQVPL